MTLSRWILEPVRSLSLLLLPLSNPFLRTANDLIAQRAAAVEKAVAEELGVNSGGYKAKIRSLFVNLKDKNNPSLREGVVSGDIPAIKFAKMTSEVLVWCSAKALD
jgi:transcription elongation factor S-II